MFWIWINVEKLDTILLSPDTMCHLSRLYYIIMNYTNLKKIIIHALLTITQNNLTYK